MEGERYIHSMHQRLTPHCRYSCGCGHTIERGTCKPLGPPIYQVVTPQRQQLSDNEMVGRAPVLGSCQTFDAGIMPLFSTASLLLRSDSSILGLWTESSVFVCFCLPRVLVASFAMLKIEDCISFSTSVPTCIYSSSSFLCT